MRVSKTASITLSGPVYWRDPLGYGKSPILCRPFGFFGHAVRMLTTRN